MLRLRQIPHDFDQVYRVQSNTVAAAVWLVISNVLAISLIVRSPEYPLIFALSVLCWVAANVVFGRLLWAGIFTSPTGVRVANVFDTFDLQWQEIERFELGRWKIVPRTCLIYLRDGRIKHAAGVGESVNLPKGNDVKIVEELNEQLARRQAEAESLNSS